MEETVRDHQSLNAPENQTAQAETKACAFAGSDENFRRQILAAFPPGKQADIRTYSPLALAFLGDAVYSLIARTAAMEKGSRQAEKLHNETAHFVSAGMQARIGDAIWDLLSEEEKVIYKRGRNSSPGHRAKNASWEEYLKATALETLCGYLYLTDQTERLLFLLSEGVRRTENQT